MSTTAFPARTSAPATTGADIEDWRPEDAAFWESRGKRVAYRNLAITPLP